MTPRSAPLLVLTLTLAGCASTTMGDHAMGALDTGSIAPGARAILAFHEEGVYAMHCHPHPWMKHTVTVVADGPATAQVEIIDDPTNETMFRYEPQTVTISTMGHVTYVNRGMHAHTATLEEE